jgi:hypothetical protein
MYLLILSLILLNQEISSDTLTVHSEIKSVTVFQYQAQIQRVSDLVSTNGKTTIVFKKLSESIIDESIQISANGNFTLLSLAIHKDYTKTITEKENIQSLKDRRSKLLETLVGIKSNLEIIGKEIVMIDATKHVISGNKLSADELNELLTIYRLKLEDAFAQRDEMRKEMDTINNEIKKIDLQINENGSIDRTYYKEIAIQIQTDSVKELEFRLDYLVNNAGWVPTYDVKSVGIKSPLEITYKAKIYQNTGIDWDDVTFTINSGDPSTNAIKPELNTQFVNFIYPNLSNIRLRGYNQLYDKNNSPTVDKYSNTDKGNIYGRIIDELTLENLPGGSIEVKKIGENRSITVTNTDRNGNFQLPKLENGNYLLIMKFVGYPTSHIPLTINNNGYRLIIKLEADLIGLDDVVVSAFGIERKENAPMVNDYDGALELIGNEFISNQTSFSYQIDIPYGVPSDGKFYSLDFKKESIPIDYIYGSVPKLDPKAYLQGIIPDWSSLNLIAGEANIYFENRFIGTSFIEPTTFDDSLTISLGKDEQINIERKQIKDFESKNIFRNKVRERVKYEIKIRNTKSQPLSIIVEDQIPVSKNDEIKITTINLSDGEINQDSGVIQWRLNLLPKETKILILEYEIEYPKGKKIAF